MIEPGRSGHRNRAVARGREAGLYNKKRLPLDMDTRTIKARASTRLGESWTALISVCELLSLTGAAPRTLGLGRLLSRPAKGIRQWQSPANQVRFSRFRGTFQQGPAHGQETQIVQS